MFQLFTLVSETDVVLQLGIGNIQQYEQYSMQYVLVKQLEEAYYAHLRPGSLVSS